MGHRPRRDATTAARRGEIWPKGKERRPGGPKTQVPPRGFCAAESDCAHLRSPARSALSTALAGLQVFPASAPPCVTNRAGRLPGVSVRDPKKP